MGLPFIGGPYDGKEIDQETISRYARTVVTNGDLGMRQFVLMPDAPDVWERMVRGETLQWDKFLPYERLQYIASGGLGGAFFRASTQQALDRALSEAKLKVHSRAATALDALSPEDRKRVIEAVDDLQHQPPETWPAEKVMLLDEKKRDYLLHVGATWRAFIRITDEGHIELLDLVREEALRLFQERQRAAGAHP